MLKNSKIKLGRTWNYQKKKLHIIKLSNNNRKGTSVKLEMLSELWIQPPIISQGRLNHIRKKKK